MDRLTDRGYKNRAFMKEPVLDEEQRLVDIIERLAAYEDTGLTPEEIVAIKHALMGVEIAKIIEFDGIPIDRLQQLAKAEKYGRLVALPE